MAMKCLIRPLWIVLALVHAGLQAAPPVVSNIRASQRPGTKLVDIYYDVTDADGDAQLVQVAASGDAGLTYTIPCVTLSGAVGAGVTPGANRHIVWNAGADWNGNFVPQTKVRVTAFDGTTPPAPPGMAYIPPGTFQMGDNLDGMTEAMPVRNVHVDGFFIDKTEVTKELWQTVQIWAVNGNGYSIAAGAFKGHNHPVHTINWYDAVKWCNARSQKEGLTPCYYTDAAQTILYKSGNVNIENAWVKWDATGYRLPTEAEWEKAARGGRTGQRYPWGNTIGTTEANYSFSGNPWVTGTQPYTSPVGSWVANDYGLFDMAGNLWEWTWDWHGSFYYGSPGSDINPLGPSSSTSRVLRGGDWNYPATGCRVAHRYSFSPSYAGGGWCFRTVRR
jgi:formylglycine-generating enzyme required for sulfatase activity